MTDEHLDEALKDLQAELSVTPSPEFAAKLRERIEHAPAKPSWNVWAWAGAVAACAVVVIAVALWEAPRQMPSTQESVTSVAQTIHAPEPTPTTSVPATETPTLKSPAPPVAPALSVARAHTEPEVLVPPDQLIAIRRLMAAVRGGAQLNVPSAPALFDPDTGELIPLKPIEIPLITVDPLPGPPDGRSGGSEGK